MSTGDRVLIHAAAGGVGLAAIKLAQQAGAEIFATAGSDEKRAFLKSLGVQHVFDSRSLDFSGAIMQRTKGQGVDLVLNSLADEFCAKSLSTLAKNGRFLEIGKRGILSPDTVKEGRPDVSYFIVDWSETNKKDPALMRSLLEKLMTSIEDSALAPLPYRVFPLENAANAFRFMAQARHIGKIVVTQQKSASRKASDSYFRANASYLITGGLGGLGLVLARWMAEKGARHLILAGRHEPSEAGRAAIEEIEKLGEKVLKDIEESMPALRGVFHLAGVLDNGALLTQDWSHFAKVLAPKVEGTWYLHTLTKNLSLDFFVMFSSVASLIGSPGQGNHAAANMFMDMLAYYRQAQGLPALSFNWGAWSEIGEAAKQGTFEWVTEHGMGTITPQAGLQVMEDLFDQPDPQVGVAPINWSVFRRQFNSSGPVPSFFADVMDRMQVKPIINEEPQKKETELLLTKLKDAPANKRKPLLLTYVQEQTRKVLGLEGMQDVHEQAPLSALGLDSLMAVELRNVIGAGLGLKRTLPATLVFDYPTVEAITNYLLSEINLSETKPQDKQVRVQGKDARTEEQTLPSVLDTLEGLSDEEAEELYTKQMMRGNNGHE
jgi:myxalamid-type polyketide synthase MxaB